MYFKRSDIQKVKQHVSDRATELNVIVGAKDDERFNKAVNTILKSKQYYEGEQISTNHMDVLNAQVKMAIENLSDYLVSNVDTLKDKVNVSNPVAYLTTAIDGFYVTAMEKLGCPNMPLFHFIPNIKNTLEESAMTIHRAYVTYDISKEDAFNQQRGKDANVVSREFGTIANGNNGNSPESIGKMIAEYQALNERQRNHGAIWRFFHKTENKDRNDLLKKMEAFIKERLPNGMKNVDLGDVNPNEISRNIADARIRGEVEIAGVKRMDPQTSLNVFGCLSSDDEIPDQNKILNELSQKEAMSRNENFVKDVLGADNVKVNQVHSEGAAKNNKLVKE